MHTTLNKIRANLPCSDGWTKLLKNLGKTRADDARLDISVILESNGFDDALWCLRAVDGRDKEIRLLAVEYARSVQHLMTDARSMNAIDVAEKFANGQATQAELDDARDTARHASWAAAAAGDAAMHASMAASAARAAAGDTAMHASRAAAAARAAARDTAMHASRAAAAAGDTAMHASRAAAAARAASWAAAAARDAARDTAWAAAAAGDAAMHASRAAAAAGDAARDTAWDQQAMYLLLICEQCKGDWKPLYSAPKEPT